MAVSFEPFRRLARWTRPLLRAVDNAGTSGAHMATWVALSPSLIPRTWWMTAFNVAASQTYGYVVGEASYGAVRRAARAWGLTPRLTDQQLRRIKVGWQAALGVATATVWATSLRQQRSVSRAVNMRPFGERAQAVGIVAGTAGFGVVLLSARAVGQVATALRPVFGRRLPAFLVPAASAVGAGVLTVTVADRLVWRNALRMVNVYSKELNQRIMPGRSMPSQAERSGSPASRERFRTLGRQGQAFVSDGPRAADISALTGKPALEPIRAYAGFTQSRDVAGTAQAAVDELERAGGFERSVIAVMTGTGTGWVEEWSASAISYLTGGDCAIVSMQYSYLTSGLAFVTDRATPRAAGKALFEAVIDRLGVLSPARRPRIFASGESLGAYGGLAAFRDAADMVGRIDGAVWIGTPRFTPMCRELTALARAGSREVAPIIGSGRHIRFATRIAELAQGFDGEDLGPWQVPRIAFLQHASDPVVWWSPSLLWKKPRWMEERAGRDVSPAVRWFPWVSFWQLAADMPNSIKAPGGFAHNYHEEVVPAWAGVLGMDALGDYGRIQRTIRASLRPRK